MGVLLIDLDDTLVPDRRARDQALSLTLTAFGRTAPLPVLWQAVREEWQASGLARLPELTGVSSWEALWTDFAEAVPDPAVQVVGPAFQARVWHRVVLSVEDVSAVGAFFRRSRETLVRTFSWVPAALAHWGSTSELWCVTNGSSWLQRRKLRLAGLEPVFTEVVVSGEIGVQKSDPRYHEVVRSRLARSGTVPIAVIGDRADTDGTLASTLAVPFVPVVPGTGPAAGTVLRCR